MATSWGIAPTDEPFDFRHQAAAYARFRRDYSPALYDAIERAAGPGARRPALDVGCGTGFVAASLARRGWRAVGIDFSAPMLAEAPPHIARCRARGEALPVRTGTAHLVTCGTAFHWMAPRDTLAEFTRALAPGGWVALFWRYPLPDEPTVRVVDGVLEAIGRPLPPVVRYVHPPDPFTDAGALVGVDPPAVFDATVEYRRDEFVGCMATIETFRRIAGDEHPRFLALLRERAARDLPEHIAERNHEYLFLARRT